MRGVLRNRIWLVRTVHQLASIRLELFSRVEQVLVFEVAYVQIQIQFFRLFPLVQIDLLNVLLERVIGFFSAFSEGVFVNSQLESSDGFVLKIQFLDLNFV